MADLMEAGIDDGLIGTAAERKQRSEAEALVPAFRAALASVRLASVSSLPENHQLGNGSCEVHLESIAPDGTRRFCVGPRIRWLSGRSRPVFLPEAPFSEWAAGVVYACAMTVWSACPAPILREIGAILEDEVHVVAVRVRQEFDDVAPPLRSAASAAYQESFREGFQDSVSHCIEVGMELETGIQFLRDMYVARVIDS